MLHQYLSAGGANMTSASLALRVLSPPEHMTLLDVTVRELIQNSIDAKNGNQAVSVSFEWIKASEEQRTGWRVALGGNINESLGAWLFNQLGDDWQLLRIKDTGTVGLSGDVSPVGAAVEDNRFNRIAFQFGVPNGNTQAGGSWGLGGKTIVFRLEPEAGLVAYFSKPAGEEPRLIICHCFDHHELQTPFAQACRLGFAWWGGACENGMAQGLVGDEAVRHARKLGFDIPNQIRDLPIGTQIMVPIRTKRIRELIAERLGGDGEEFVAEIQVGEDLLRRNAATEVMSAVQRWYWPRLVGRVVGTRSVVDLQVTVGNWDDGEGILRLSSPDFGNPLYFLLSELYIKTFGGLQSEVIQPEKYGQPLLGRLAKTVTADQDVLRAFAHESCALGQDVQINNWLVAHVRDAGMVVSYSLMPSMAAASGGRRRVQGNQEGSLHLAVARVDGINSVECAPAGDMRGTRSLEEIFRMAEDPTHSNWSEKPLRERQGQIGTWPKSHLSVFHRKICELLTPTDLVIPPEPPDSGRSLSRLSQSLGAALLPEGFGEGPGGLKGGGGSGTSGSGGVVGSIKVRLTACDRDGDSIRLTADAKGLKPLDSVFVDFVVLGERGPITRTQWETDSTEAYPLELTGCATVPNAPAGSIELKGQQVFISANGQFTIEARLNHGDWFVDAIINRTERRDA